MHKRYQSNLKNMHAFLFSVQRIVMGIHIHTKKNFKIGSPDTGFIWKYAYFLIFLNITTGKETRPDLRYFTFSCGILHFPLPLPLRPTLSLCLMFVHNLFLALPRYIHDVVTVLFVLFVIVTFDFGLVSRRRGAIWTLTISLTPFGNCQGPNKPAVKAIKSGTIKW